MFGKTWARNAKICMTDFSINIHVNLYTYITSMNLNIQIYNLLANSK